MGPGNVQGGKWTRCGDLVKRGRREQREKTGVQVLGPGGRWVGTVSWDRKQRRGCGEAGLLVTAAVTGTPHLAAETKGT